MKEFDIESVDPEMMDVVKEFPKIFLEPSEYISQWLVKYPDNMPKKEDLVNLRYGFEHGTGWKEIVRGFCKEIQEFCDDKPIQYSVELHLEEIKSTWGNSCYMNIIVNSYDPKKKLTSLNHSSEKDILDKLEKLVI